MIREIVLKGRGPNTMSLESLRRFNDELAEVGDEPLLVRGHGRAFSAGLDLRALEDVDAIELLGTIEAAARSLLLHPAPTAACINGHAVAGGCLLTQCCDVRIVGDDESIRLGMTGVALGLIYPPLVLRVFRARVPAASVDWILLHAERFGPARALALGLVDEVVPDPRAVATARLEALAKLPRLSYAATKLALRSPIADISEEEAAAFRESAAIAWDPARLARLRK